MLKKSLKHRFVLCKCFIDHSHNTKNWFYNGRLQTFHCCYTPVGGGGVNAKNVPYGDVPPIRVYFLTFESETGSLFSSLTLKQGAKFVLSLRARVPIHSTDRHPLVGFNLFVYCPGNQS